MNCFKENPSIESSGATATASGVTAGDASVVPPPAGSSYDPASAAAAAASSANAPPPSTGYSNYNNGSSYYDNNRQGGGAGGGGYGSSGGYSSGYGSGYNTPPPHHHQGGGGGGYGSYGYGQSKPSGGQYNDWICPNPSCSFMNYQSRAECFKCRTARPASAGPAMPFNAGPPGAPGEKIAKIRATDRPGKGNLDYGREENKA